MRSMRKLRGFSMKQRVTTLFRRIFRRRTGNYRRLNQPPRFHDKLIPTVMSWTHRFTTKAKAICSRAHQVSGGYEKHPLPPEAVAVPKGHLAVYVGEKGGDFQRVLVPVIYFNHPLFGELLRGAEEEFGFNHPGGITLPCRISEFERVQTRIRQVCGSQKMIVRW